MKRNTKTWLTTTTLWAAVSLVATPHLAVALPIHNTATGDIAGDPAELTDSNTLTINVSTPPLVMAASQDDEVELTSGDSLSKDVLFTYQADTNRADKPRAIEAAMSTPRQLSLTRWTAMWLTSPARRPAP